MDYTANNSHPSLECRREIAPFSSLRQRLANSGKVVLTKSQMRLPIRLSLKSLRTYSAFITPRYSSSPLSMANISSRA